MVIRRRCTDFHRWVSNNRVFEANENWFCLLLKGGVDPVKALCWWRSYGAVLVGVGVCPRLDIFSNPFKLGTGPRPKQLQRTRKKESKHIYIHGKICREFYRLAALFSTQDYSQAF